MRESRFLSILAVAICLAGSSCSSLYYASMEKFGKEKRDILVGRVKDVREDQEKAKEQFKTTLEAFQAVTGFDGGDLEKTYKKLNGELEDAESRARKVHDRVDSVEKVAKDMFGEWEGEINAIQDRTLKSKSRELLLDTRQRYTALLTKMRTAEKRMEPVLAAFRDQVLFLKHNLNAKAIRSLKETTVQIDGEVTKLVADLESSIQEADAFIAAMAS
ncbi:MAG: DUF2959 domain-containing protein [Bryobacterales bacterium]|nr:DUF2959 domain-containing protein [Bryobacterales bacterium]